MVPLDSAEEAQRLTQSLVERGVIIRHLGSFGIPNAIRISIGTGDENAFLFETLQQVMAAA